MTHLLRVEGVNLSNVIDDTDQLSVRRGGGLMLLNVASQLKELLTANEGTSKIGERLTAIATGASIGLFEFELDSEMNPEVVRDAVAKFLQTAALKYRQLTDGHQFETEESELPLSHATFVVDVVEVQNDDVQQAEQLAVARNRRRQLKQPTLSLDDLWLRPSEFLTCCTMDRTRPATGGMDINADTKNAPVCKSTRDRWFYGRGARQKFYHDELQTVAQVEPHLASILSKLWTTNDLQVLAGRELSQGDDRDEVEIPDHLLDKIAVFYVDGNKFGQRGRDIFKSQKADGFRDWSAALKNHHRQLLARLIALTDNDPLWKNGDEIRLETLLWGGDEIMWVVPAWKGWEVAKWFFEQPHEVKSEGNAHSLTYACGLVFCHTKAPIKNTSALAHKLADLAKQSRSEEHAIAYEVLESYDDISGDLEQHRKRFLPASRDIGNLVLNPQLLTKHWDVLTAVAHCSEVPIRQLHTLCNAWKRGNDFKTPETRLLRACKEAELAIEDWLNGGAPVISEPDRATHTPDLVQWLHLHQMRPYLPKPSSRNSKRGAES